MWRQFCRAALPDLDPAVVAKWDLVFASQLAPSPARQYHNIHHITDLLRKQANTEFASSLRIGLAIWFHDLVYDGRSSENEELSAQQFLGFALDARLDPEMTQEVHDWILETKRHTTSQYQSAHHQPEFDLFLDLDLSILGSHPTQYDAYAKQVRQEYAHVPQQQFALARGRFLQALLSSPTPLYRTPRFQLALASQAKQNLEREVSLLGCIT